MRASPYKVPFLVFEGLDGSGKTTLSQALSKIFAKHQVPHIRTREPGGSSLGEDVRRVLKGVKGQDKIDPLTEALLLNAARRDHVEHVILPALRAGQWVVCDRYVESTYAYQGGVCGVPQDTLESLHHLSVNSLMPDLTFFINTPIEVCLERLERRYLDTKKTGDRFEQWGAQNLAKLQHTYETFVQKFPHTHKVIDADVPIKMMHTILLILNDMFDLAFPLEKLSDFENIFSGI